MSAVKTSRSFIILYQRTHCINAASQKEELCFAQGSGDFAMQNLTRTSFSSLSLPGLMSSKLFGEI